MLKKVVLPLVLLVSASAHASINLESWLDLNNVREKYELLSVEEQSEVAATLKAFEDLSVDFQKAVAEAAEQHKNGVNTIKELFGTKTLEMSVKFTSLTEEVTEAAPAEVVAEQAVEAVEATCGSACTEAAA